MDQKFFVELDALLDTRLGVISKLDPEAATELVGSLDYKLRQSDDMGLLTKRITTKQFHEAYEKRDVNTLMASGPTVINAYLSKVIDELEKQKAVTNMIDSIEVDINIWPYQLTEDERMAICEAVTARCGLITPVRTVNIPPEELTFEYLKEKDYAVVILYNFSSWIEPYMERLDPKHLCRNPRMVIHAPAILKEGRLKPEDEIQSDNGQSIDPFDIARMFFAELFALQHMPVDMFCIIDPLPQ